MVEAGPPVRCTGHKLDLITAHSIPRWRGDRRRPNSLGVKVTADQAPGAPGEGSGQGNRGRELTAGPCVGEVTAGGGMEAFVGGEWSAVAGKGRVMLLRLKGKERMVKRRQMCANRGRGGGSPEWVAGGDALAQNGVGKRLPMAEMGKTGLGNGGR
jgi:hypothetical protein